jgi:peptidoglycan/LPS O-acetylase OafA/YrhL
MATNYIGLYAKAAAGGVTAAFAAYVSAVQDGPGVAGYEFLSIVLAFVVGCGAVWLVPNLPAGVSRYLKAGVGALVAVLSALITGWTDGSINASEWYAALFAGLAALGLVGVVPNAAESDPVDVSTKKLVGVTRAQKSALVTGSTV